MEKLKPLSSRQSRVRFIAFDIEADNWIDLLGIGVYDGRVRLLFEGKESPQAFLEWALVRSRKGAWILSHYGGAYDMLFLEPYLRKMKHLETEWIMSGTRAVMAIVRNDKSKLVWKFVDSFSFLPTGLAKLAERFNVGLKKVDIDFDKPVSEQDWKERVLIDCEILYRVAECWQSQVLSLGGESRVTAASTAMTLWRKRYQKRELYPCRSLRPFIRQAYYGGRCEIFRVQGKELHYLDFSSHYPKAMLERMPVGFPHIGKGEPPKESVGVAEARVTIPDMHIPPLPFRFEDSLFFPTGLIQGNWDIDELRYAESLGCKVEYGKTITWEADYLFRDYVTDMYRLKEEGGWGETAKLLLNSLYGKFGQNEMRDCFIENPLEENNDAIPLNDTATIVLVKKIVDAPYILPEIACHVTALARIRWHQYALRCGCLYYGDTDSFITDSDISEGVGLGSLQHQLLVERFLGLLPKLYFVKVNGKWILKAKGFKLEKGETVEPSRLFEGITKKSLIKLRGQLRKQLDSPKLIQMLKRIRKTYTKRRVLPNGDTVPWNVAEMTEEKRLARLNFGNWSKNLPKSLDF